MELFSLKGKTAVVTGALGLIGRKHCEALAAAGANVVVADLGAEQTAKFAAGLGENHLGLEVDVTSKASLVDALNAVLNKYDSVDILVNNAAINDKFENPAMAKELSAFENYPLEAFQLSLNVNVTGVFLCSQVFGTQMSLQGSGSIINIASTYGMVGPDQTIYRDAQGQQTFYKSAAYPVTKGAIINFTRFLAAYWGHTGVRVNTLSPGGVEAGQTEDFIGNYSAKTLLGRMAKASDYQGALIFLASEASAYMTGANLVVDGGWTAI
ncbi:NAD(P)-dependent dehydrogenase (short-subunit alcohol dehydrogenase family) [Mucilaginibacter oryzae]|uniref:NAD(P)-dependent dehydrogenase (Short-subunit alcohol dehydrogenase family) n=1 Tax=Mucilaginibacter oryzae TaxID=468058 RepID=A0A316HAS7_9SPHI|nr:SDR family oxidoreductase [Mucilaginibacter oryzae]PWK78309.1 NAD(P)-dependent dehydrogenase (short-subunit alcohol dehydrogenase family) [Mucilaginibacter oryzae]